MKIYPSKRVRSSDVLIESNERIKASLAKVNFVILTSFTLTLKLIKTDL